MVKKKFELICNSSGKNAVEVDGELLEELKMKNMKLQKRLKAERFTKKLMISLVLSWLLTIIVGMTCLLKRSVYWLGLEFRVGNDQLL